MTHNQITHILSLLAPVVSGEELQEVKAALTAAVQNSTVADLQDAGLTELYALRRFKTYVHERLDAAGVDKHEEQNAINGCRIGSRLDDVLPHPAKEYEWVRDNSKFRGRWIEKNTEPHVAQGIPVEPFVVLSDASNPSKCSPLSCDGCPQCQPEKGGEQHA